MVFVDISAWIEYLRDGVPEVVRTMDRCLEGDPVGIGDLIYCEVIQGIRTVGERERVSALLRSLPRCDMVGFRIAGKAAENYRYIRSRGVTVRKTIDVIIGTFCAENAFETVHIDRDFSMMAGHNGLRKYAA